jgi:hypothetical protein
MIHSSENKLQILFLIFFWLWLYIYIEWKKPMDIYFLFLSLDNDVIQFVSLIRLTNRNCWWIISLSSYFTFKQKQTTNILHLIFYLTIMSSSKNKILKFNQKVERSVNFDSFIIDDSFCFQKQFTKICRLLIENHLQKPEILREVVRNPILW